MSDKPKPWPDYVTPDLPLADEDVAQIAELIEAMTSDDTSLVFEIVQMIDGRAVVGAFCAIMIGEHEDEIESLTSLDRDLTSEEAERLRKEREIVRYFTDVLFKLTDDVQANPVQITRF